MKKIFTLCVVLCMSYLSMGATNLKHEFRATWLTTAWGNDWPKTKVTNATTRKQQQDSLIAIFDRLQAGNMNAVCLQVRGRSDAFYQSSYEPWAAELAGARGKDPGYDPLAFAIEEAHKRGLELHAWVNPFRVTSAGTLDANDLVKKNAGQWIIQYNNGSFTGEIIDPGYPEAREYVLNVLMEIISNYDIDGIVMDDYFYPYGGTTTEDAASKASHKPANVVDVNQDGYTDDDWRRSNVDVFLKEFYNRIQTTKPWVRLGMGTFGIWTTQSKVAQAYGISLPSGISGLDDYDEQACNPVEWVKNGYVDYINPQLYWPTTSTGQNYNKLCQWWAKDVCEHFSNQLTNGKKVHFFSSQSISSNSAVSEIQAEIDANRSNLSSGYTGSVFFDTDAYLTMDQDLMTSRFATNALTPPMDWKSNTALAAPTNLTVSGSTLTWQHATAERFTVYVYPKGTAWSTAKNDPSYLQGVIYGNSMDISGIDTNANDIAVCAYDRFGVEHTAAVYSNDSGAGTTPNPETIIWELNGGEVNTVTVEVPSLTTLEAQFKNDYNSYFGASVATTREITNFLYYGSKEEGGSNLVYNMMNDPASDWTWLRDYIISKSASNTTIQTALLAGTDAHWRYSIVAFLTASAGTNSTYTVDFSIAGQPSKWGTAYQIAHGAVLLPTYVTSAYTLPTPVHPSGYEFLGWYDNAEFAGSPLTTIPANWTGTLYAQWQENALTIDPTWQILYTSTDGNIVTPYATDVFGANIVSNTYENGVGTITFDGPVTSIGDWAFWSCESLTSVTLPNSVTSIGDYAFYQCTSLTSITLPNSVTRIGNGAFEYSSLTSITLPNSVTSIGDRAFSGCDSLISIVVEDGNATYDSRTNCNAIIETATNTLIAGCQNTIIPNSVTSIEDYAFFDRSSLTSITIPNSVTSIGYEAFGSCSSLTSLTIPNSVTSIGGGAFYGCSSLTDIAIPNSVTSIGDYAFSSCGAITSMVVENGNTIYDSRENCNAIIETATNTLIAGCQNTIIPNSVTSIGGYAFRGCSSLTSITIPNSVTSIGYEAFFGCSSLTSITIPNGVTSIGVKAFDGCSSLTSITIPNSVTSIGETAFGWCSSLTSITIPNSVTSIGEGAFDGCSSLTSITIPNSVTSIGSYAFFGCSSLTSITIPNGVTSIGSHAFSGCSSLTSITIPNSVTSIGETAFDGCSSLDTIYVEATTPPALEDSTVFMNTPSPVCVIPCGTLETYQTSDWANYMGRFVEECTDPASAVTFDADVDKGNAVTDSNNAAAYQISKNGVTLDVSSGMLGTYNNEMHYRIFKNNSITVTSAGRNITKIEFICTANDNEQYGPGWFVVDDGNYAYSGAVGTWIGDAPSVTFTTSAYQVRATQIVVTLVDEEQRITYKQNGGITNDYGWTSKGAIALDLQADYNATYGTSKAWAKAENGYIYYKIGTDWVREDLIPEGTDCTVTGFMQNVTYNTTDDLKKLINDNEKYTWLKDVIITSRTAAGLDVTDANLSETVYRKELSAFFLCSPATSSWPASSSYETAGQYEFFKTIWRHAFANPTNPTEEFVLNAPYREGYTFAGWYTTPNFSGGKIETIDVTTAGTLYAKWSRPQFVIFDADVDKGNAGIDSNNATAYQIYKNGVTLDVTSGILGTYNNEYHYRIYKNSSITISSIVGNIAKIEFRCTANNDERYGPGCFTVDSGDYTYSDAVGTWTGDAAIVTFNASANQVRATQIEVTLVDKLLQEKGITYELNGGVTNDHGWMSKDDMYHDLLVDINAIIPTTRVDVDTVTLAYDKTKNIQKGIPTYWDDLSSLLIHSDFLSKWGWLINYMDSACASESKYLPSTLSVYLRYNLSAFFFEKEYTSWPQTPDYSKYGLYPYYQPAWQHAYDNPTNPTEEFILNAPYREGYTFAGWYTNADLSGEKITIVEAETNDTLYAKWIENSLVESTWKVLYTSTNGGIVAPNAIDVFGANIISNTYENGVGTITFDGPVTSIGTEAFHDCLTLKSITIPNSVNSIGVQAFRDCSAIDSLTIPENVNSISGWAFMDCSSLLSIVVAQENMTYDSRENCNAIIETATNTLIVGCKKTIIPNGVAIIGEHAFRISSLAFITIPNSVTNIERLAFCGSSIDTIYVEATTPPALADSTVFMYTPSPICVIPCGTLAAYEVSDWASQVGGFVEDCVEGQQIYYTSTDGNIVTPYATDVFGANIVSNTYENGQGVITFDGPVTSIGDRAFYYDCTSLTSIAIPNSVTSIGNDAFNGCTFLSSITIPNGVTTIGDRAFYYCSSLTSITIPNSVTEIGSWAFSNCSGLTSIVVDVENTTYDSRENCHAIIETATNTLITGCQNTIIPNSVTSIGRYAFYGCDGLTSITIPNSVTSIGNDAFNGCTFLSSITIPNGVTTIGANAFLDCSSLTSITVPNSVTSIGVVVLGGCASLTSIVVEDDNATYDSRNNCNAIIETSTNTLIAGCQNTIIPNNVTSIGTAAFRGCSAMVDITIPNSITTIGWGAFQGCSSLTSITIPNSVTSILKFAFYDCSSLDRIRVEATNPPILKARAFEDTPSPTCYIPCGTLDAYQASDWASQVGEFVEEGCVPIQMCGDDLYWEYADGLLTITGTGDMYDYAADTDVPWYDVRGNIKTINMPDEMTKIGDYAFYKCTALTSVTLPEQLKHIGNRAFAQDTKIAGNIVIPEGVNYIEERAFFNLTGVLQFQVLATTPPTLESTNVFTNVNAPIVIPCGYGLVYRKANIWKDLNLSTCEVLIDNLYYMPVGDNEAHIIGYDNKPAGTLTIPGSVVIGSKTRTVTTLADSLFFDCKEISSVIFNEGLESIGERVYVRCGLTGTIVLPSTLTTIGERAFSYCDNVEKYILQAMTPPALANDVFTGSNSKALFYISCEAMDDYKVATNWSSLKSRLRDACLNIYHYNTALGANGVYTTEDALVASIYYRRKFTPYRWETLYLPFEVDRVTVLENGLEYDLTAWDIVDGGHYFLAKPDGMLNKEILFGFTNELESHTPYIIQFSDAYYTDKLITFYGKESWNKLSTSFEVLSSSAWMQIAGNTTLQDQLLEKPVYMLRSGLDFILQKTTTTLHPFECYVMPYATPSGTPARMNVRFRGDVPTAVESVKGNESHLTYTVDGYTLTVYPQGQAFSIYSLNGALIYSCEAGKEAVDCELNSGCYLLHAGTETHKIML